MFDSSTNIHFSPCLHRRVTTEITGSRRIVEGEVWDDIQERLVCLECGEYVTEEEVRAGWGQFPFSKEEVSHGDD
jgi:hypothetical protein